MQIRIRAFWAFLRKWKDASRQRSWGWYETFWYFDFEYESRQRRDDTPRPRTELKNVLLASTRMKIERIGSVCQRMNQKALVQIQDPSRGFTTAVHMLDNNPRDEHVAAPPSGLRFL